MQDQTRQAPTTAACTLQVAISPPGLKISAVHSPHSRSPRRYFVVVVSVPSSVSKSCVTRDDQRCQRGQGLARTLARRRQRPRYNTAVVARIFLERRDPGDDLRRLADLFNCEPAEGAATGECSPPLDVMETTAAVELLVDLPGVDADGVRVIVSRGTLVIAGRKLPQACAHQEAAFHLAERSFGRFTRIVRLSGAVDAGRATATLVSGELHIVLPRIDERRGQEIRIPVRRATD
jgi:HSP20 family molecular chaperone IbpA